MANTYDITTNSIKIYRTQLTPNRNALLSGGLNSYRRGTTPPQDFTTGVCGIERYLKLIETHPVEYTGTDALTYSDDNFQFVKPGLDITIKINVDNENNFTYKSIGNYVRIEQRQYTQEEETESNNNVRIATLPIPDLDEHVSVWYYFIVGSKWVSQKTLELQLSMDTINTFGKYLLNEDLWSDKTAIIREHIDRYEFINHRPVKKIDRVSEDIIVPYLLEQNNSTIEEPNSTGTEEWYLVYKTANAAKAEGETGSSQNSLKAYIYPKTSVVYQQQAGTPGSIFTLNPNSFSNADAIYGITTGGISFSNIKVYPHYFSYGSNKIYLYSSTDYADRDSFGSGSTISGRVSVGDTFMKGSTTYTCFAVVWYKNGSVLGDTSYIDLPIGLFKSDKSGDNEVHYALYIETINGVTYNGWYFRERDAEYEYGWQYSTAFTYIEFSKGFTFGALSILKDTTNRSDNWAQTKYDTNWSRNGLYFNSGVLTFTADTQKVYRLVYDVKTPNAQGLNNGTVFHQNGTAGGTGKTSSIDLIDREDSKLVKILALPYCPTEISISSGSIESGIYTISFDANIVELEDGTGDESGYKLIRYKHINNTFGKYLDSIQIDYTPSSDFYEWYYGDGELKEKSYENEPKLLNSSYYKDLFIYDDVSKNIRREDILLNNQQININTYYQPTNTLTSSMLFKFDIDGGSYSDMTPWDDVLISSRNNELPIYNNEYLNYMRYGYNAEKANIEATAKAQRQATTTSNAISVVGGVVGGAVSGAAMGAKFGGVYGAAAGAVIGTVVGAVSSAAKAVSASQTTETAIANAQRSLESKVNSLQNTASTVQGGSSAVDLMTTYTNNRLHYATYVVPELMREALYDRFYYCGYSHPVQAKPNLNTRWCFNFVQCEPIFNEESTWNYHYFLDDIKQRFINGVTIYHPIATIIDDQYLYDFNQQYENWENIDLEYIPIPNNLMWMRNSLINPYNRTFVWLNNITNPEENDFKPDENNTFRYEIEYSLTGSDEWTYPYASAEDRENRYTLNQTSINPIQDLDNINVQFTNGAKIWVRIIDIDEGSSQYEASSSLTAELNQQIVVEYESLGQTVQKTLIRNGTVEDYQNERYYKWVDVDTGVGLFYTKSSTPNTSYTDFYVKIGANFIAQEDMSVIQIKSVWKTL